MKRFKVTSMVFDSRAHSLNLDINDSWEPKVIEQHLRNREQTILGLIKEYGETNSDMKIRNFAAIKSPTSIISEHNLFYFQARDSAVIGAYYPALTALCTLGERILNYLTFSLLDKYPFLTIKKKLYGKASCDDWDKMLEFLNGSNILLEKPKMAFEKLKKIRNYVVHYNAELGDMAILTSKTLEAFELMYDIIEFQFGIGFMGQPWFIKEGRGVSFIKKEWEENPFIQLVYLPNSIYLGPYYIPSYNFTTAKFEYSDEYVYDLTKEITDKEFIDLLEANQKASS